jgi:hypothetical protein
MSLKHKTATTKNFHFSIYSWEKKKKTFDVGEITNSLYFFIPGYGLCN